MNRMLPFLLIGVFAAWPLFNSIADSALDLPVVKPRYVDPAEPVPTPSKIKLPPPPTLPVEGPRPETTPPPVFFSETIPTTQSIIYVLDYSQTMGQVAERVNYNTTLSRWDVVLREANASVGRLSEALDFNLVVFGTNRGCGVAIWSGSLLKATDSNKASALAWLNAYQDAMVYGGSTPTAPAVLAALEFSPTSMVLLTDGQPSPCGLFGEPISAHRKRIESANVERVRIDVFGIGLNPKPREFCLGVASDSGGMFHEIHRK